MGDSLFNRYFYKIKKDKVAFISLIIISLLIIASILIQFYPKDPNAIDISNGLVRPSKENFFGTDDLGRDYFTRVFYGGRASLAVGFLAMIISTVIGTIVGVISGYYGGIVDDIIMRIIDIIMSIPSFCLILILNSYLKPGIKNIIIRIGLFGWMGIARIVRAETLSLKEREYVLYAKMIGIKDRLIMIRHIIKNIFSTVVVTSTINIASAILTESSLSFLGLGVQQPNSSWGSMLRDAQKYLGEYSYLALFPGLLILITVLCFNVLGDSLRYVVEAKSEN